MQCDIDPLVRSKVTFPCLLLIHTSSANADDISGVLHVSAAWEVGVKFVSSRKVTISTDGNLNIGTLLSKFILSIPLIEIRRNCSTDINLNLRVQ